MLEKRCLYVGGDDSNHAGDSKGEIIVATFSYDPEDSIVKFLNYRNKEKLRAWLKLPHRDYRFAILTAEKYRHTGENLGAIIPDIIEIYLRQRRISVPSMRVYLDGKISDETMEGVRDRIFGFWKGNPEDLVIKSFAKKGKKGKRSKGRKHRCPQVVYYADALAHSLNERKTTPQQLFKHEKLVFVRAA